MRVILLILALALVAFAQTSGSASFYVDVPVDYRQGCSTADDCVLVYTHCSADCCGNSLPTGAVATTFADNFQGSFNADCPTSDNCANTICESYTGAALCLEGYCVVTDADGTPTCDPGVEEALLDSCECSLQGFPEWVCRVVDPAPTCDMSAPQASMDNCECHYNEMNGEYSWACSDCSPDTAPYNCQCVPRDSVPGGPLTYALICDSLCEPNVLDTLADPELCVCVENYRDANGTPYYIQECDSTCNADSVLDAGCKCQAYWEDPNTVAYRVECNVEVGVSDCSPDMNSANLPDAELCSCVLQDGVVDANNGPVYKVVCDSNCNADSSLDAGCTCQAFWEGPNTVANRVECNVEVGVSDCSPDMNPANLPDAELCSCVLQDGVVDANNGPVYNLVCDSNCNSNSALDSGCSCQAFWESPSHVAYHVECEAQVGVSDCNPEDPSNNPDPQLCECVMQDGVVDANNGPVFHMICDSNCQPGTAVENGCTCDAFYETRTDVYYHVNCANPGCVVEADFANYCECVPSDANVPGSTNALVETCINNCPDVIEPNCSCFEAQTAHGTSIRAYECTDVPFECEPGQDMEAGCACIESDAGGFVVDCGEHQCPAAGIKYDGCVCDWTSNTRYLTLTCTDECNPDAPNSIPADCDCVLAEKLGQAVYLLDCPVNPPNECEQAGAIIDGCLCEASETDFGVYLRLNCENPVEYCEPNAGNWPTGCECIPTDDTGSYYYLHCVVTPPECNPDEPRDDNCECLPVESMPGTDAQHYQLHCPEDECEAEGAVVDGCLCVAHTSGQGVVLLLDCDGACNPDVPDSYPADCECLPSDASTNGYQLSCNRDECNINVEQEPGCICFEAGTDNGEAYFKLECAVNECEDEGAVVDGCVCEVHQNAAGVYLKLSCEEVDQCNPDDPDTIPEYCGCHLAEGSTKYQLMCEQPPNECSPNDDLSSDNCVCEPMVTADGQYEYWKLFCWDLCQGIESADGCRCNPDTGDYVCCEDGCQCNDVGEPINCEVKCEFLVSFDRQVCECDVTTGHIDCGNDKCADLAFADNCQCDPNTGNIYCPPVCNSPFPTDDPTVRCRCVAAEFFQAPEDGSTGVWECRKENLCANVDLQEGCRCNPDNGVVSCVHQCEGERPYDQCYCSYYVDVNDFDAAGGAYESYQGGWVCPPRCDPNAKPADSCQCLTASGNLQDLRWYCDFDLCSGLERPPYDTHGECYCGTSVATDATASGSSDGVKAEANVVAEATWVCSGVPDDSCCAEADKYANIACDKWEAEVECNPDTCEWEHWCPPPTSCDCGTNIPVLTQDVHGCNTNEATIWCERDIAYAADGSEVVASNDINREYCGEYKYSCNTVEPVNYCTKTFDCGLPRCRNLDPAIVGDYMAPECPADYTVDCRARCVNKYASCEGVVIGANADVSSCEWAYGEGLEECVELCNAREQNQEPVVDNELKCRYINDECGCSAREDCGWCQREISVENDNGAVSTRVVGTCYSIDNRLQCRNDGGSLLATIESCACEGDECAPKKEVDTPPPEKPKDLDEVGQCLEDKRCANPDELDETIRSEGDLNFEITVELVIAGSSADNANVVSLSIDVSGEGLPSSSDLEAICEVLSSGLRKMLGLDDNVEMTCAFSRVGPSNSKRAATTTSYIADVTMETRNDPTPGPVPGPIGVERVTLPMMALLIALALLF